MPKALLIPKYDFTFWSIFRDPISSLHKRIKHYFRFINPSYESLYYQKLGLFPNKIHFSVLGRIHPRYYQSVPNYQSSNPSGFGVEHIDGELSLTNCENIVKKYDIILISRSNFSHSEGYWRAAKKLNKLIVIIDFEEDFYFYKDGYDAVRGLRHKEDFSLYFKNHLRLGYADDFLLPLAPTPINLSMYKIDNVSEISDRKIDYFYSGIVDKSDTALNRQLLLENFKERTGAEINIISVDDHYNNKLHSIQSLHQKMSNSKFILCPAGRAWQTIRHTTAGVFGCVPIVPFPDVETITFNAEDMKNGIYYEMLYNKTEIEKKKIIQDLLEKLDEIKNNHYMLSDISNTWHGQVVQDHTTVKRAEYLINNILAKY